MQNVINWGKRQCFHGSPKLLTHTNTLKVRLKGSNSSLALVCLWYFKRDLHQWFHSALTLSYTTRPDMQSGVSNIWWNLWLAFSRIYPEMLFGYTGLLIISVMRRGQQSRVISAAGRGGVLSLVEFNEVSMQMGNLQQSTSPIWPQILNWRGLHTCWRWTWAWLAMS